MPNATARALLEPLLQPVDPPCVSIFCRVDHRTAEPEKNRTRLDNLLRAAGERLRTAAPEVDVDDILAPVRTLRDESFWRGATAGLALFAAPRRFHRLALPFAVADRVSVGRRFHLRPLLPLLAEGEFHVLALSTKEARLLSVRDGAVERADLGDTAFDTVMGYVELDANLQPREPTPAGGAGGRAAAMLDASEERFKEDLAHYFKRLGERVEPRLRQGAPVVLATVEEHLPLVRAAMRHAHFLDEVIAGNPEPLADETLAERARPLVTAWRRRRGVERLHEMSRRGQAAERLEDIVTAAAEGRVDTLLVAEGVEEWGVFDADLQSVEVHLRAEPGDEDLVDRAAVETLRRGGAVVAVPVELAPNGAVAALRY